MKTYAFIDASNLFYGGEKSLGWKIDYLKLLKYLKSKYKASKIFYFGGVEIRDFYYDYQKYDNVPIVELEKYLSSVYKKENRYLDEQGKYYFQIELSKIRFYLKLQEFGYKIYLKPVKTYFSEKNYIEKKANCDVEMAFYMMKEIKNYQKVVFLSGDGDFLPLLKHMREVGKEVIVLARGERTAREVRQFAGGNFKDFATLKSAIFFGKELKKRADIRDIRPMSSNNNCTKKI